ncbi:MAG: chloride channel protein, partial [Planctomycetes bacterium]|nr:chloride channel protein [Planctomycetota bacterium]
AWAARLLHHETGRWVILAGSVGVICGISGFILTTATDLVSRLLLQHIVGLSPLIAAPHPGSEIDGTRHHAWLAMLVVLGAGGALSAWLATRFAPAAKGGGTSHAIQCYHHQRGRIPLSVPVTKLIASVVTLGSGGSAGREGPITLVGAGFASFFAQRLRLSVRDQRILLAAGIAGGIAAVFHAPLAAALFAAEVLYRSSDLESETLIPAFIAAIVGYCVSGQLDGLWCTLIAMPAPLASTLFIIPPGLAFGVSDWPQLAGYGLVALTVVMVGRWFVDLNVWVFQQVELSPRPWWMKAGIGAVAAGAVAMALYGACRLMLPDGVEAELSLSTLGSGYGAIHWVLGADSSVFPRGSVVVLLTAIALGKVVTTVLTVASGGSGGMFGPSIVIGGCLGGAVGMAIHGLAIAPPPAACTLMGMAGLLAATHRTPLAGMLMVAEISGSYLLLIPSMWVSGIAFLLMGRRSLLVGQAERIQDSPAHRSHLFSDLFADTTVGDLLPADDPRSACISVGSHDAVEACREAMATSGQSIVPVVDADRRLVGVVTQDDLRGLARDALLDRLVVCEDLMSGAATALVPTDSLARAMRRLTSQHVDELPVVGAQRRLIGLISRRMLLDHYREAVERIRADRTEEGYDVGESGRKEAITES